MNTESREKGFFRNLEDGVVECLACAWHCRIKPGKTGICGVKKNLKSKLISLVYGQAIGICPDPVEKKPLYHFLPGSRALSFGTFGCNFDCLFCQNWFQSQSPKEKGANVTSLNREYSQEILPEQIVKLAKKMGCSSIAYTYNEPAVFVKYAFETMVLAKKAGLKNIWVSNGFISEQTFDLIKDYLDAINIDLKSFDQKFYQKICRAKIGPVLENIRKFWQAGIWTEVTTLVVPDENDSPSELKKIADFLVKISVDIPWHVSAFYPAYLMKGKKPTSQKNLLDAWRIGQKAGLRYTYAGNISLGDWSNTFCPVCRKVLVERDDFAAREIRIAKGKCVYCQSAIPGVWE